MKFALYTALAEEGQRKGQEKWQGQESWKGQGQGKKEGKGISKGTGKCKIKKKEQKIRITQKSAKKAKNKGKR